MASSIPNFTILSHRLALDLEWLAVIEPDAFEAVVDALANSQSFVFDMVISKWGFDDDDDDLEEEAHV